ncbi:MAG: Trp biosynthesis-associated membrane protein [Solirubrobacterales bacterium]
MSAGAADRQKRGIRGRLPSVEILLPVVCFASALVLGFSELLITFEFIPPGGEPQDVGDTIRMAGDRHSYSLMILAVFAVAAVAVAVMSGSKPAAIAVAVAGGVALLIFLLSDLPDAGKVGTLDDPRQSFTTAEAVPQAGFWLELLGALSLAVSGAALATLTPEQLAMGERFSARRKGAPDDPEDEDDEQEPDPKPTAKRKREPEEKGTERVKDRVERVRRRK